jgi:hypothetical protein
MSVFPENYNSFEDWVSFIRSFSIEEINEFIRHEYHVGRGCSFGVIWTHWQVVITNGGLTYLSLRPGALLL